MYHRKPKGKSLIAEHHIFDDIVEAGVLCKFKLKKGHDTSRQKRKKQVYGGFRRKKDEK